MDVNAIELMNESAEFVIHQELVSLYKEFDESDEDFYLNGKYLHKGSRFKSSDTIMDFSRWIAKIHNIFDVGKYHVSHYIEYLRKYEDYEPYIKMEIENDLQILQLAIIRHFHKKGQYPNMFITSRNQFDIVYCPYCHNIAQLKADEHVYGKSFGNNIYICDDCEAQVSTQGKSIVPKGTMAKQDLRKLRMSCYDAIQSYLINHDGNYGKMLNKLEELLDVSEEHIRISTLTTHQCYTILQDLEAENMKACS